MKHSSLLGNSSLVIRHSSIVYPALRRTSTTRQRFRALNGLVSTIRTWSPTLQELFSSWARNFEVFLIVFLYKRCCTSLSTATVTVFCMDVLVTTPTWVLRIPRFL